MTSGLRRECVCRRPTLSRTDFTRKRVLYNTTQRYTFEQDHSPGCRAPVYTGHTLTYYTWP